jgi:hypothetical protein
LIRTSGERLCRTALALCAALILTPAQAEQDGTELMMFDAPDCSYCLQWEAEVGVIYAKTDEGRQAPLVRMPLSAAPSQAHRLREPVRFTPTFVLLRDGQEVARITGYPGEDHFWGLLAGMLHSSMRPQVAPGATYPHIQH